MATAVVLMGVQIKSKVRVRESIDGRRLNGAGYLIEVVGLGGSHKTLENRITNA